MNHIQHGVALAGAQVVHLGAGEALLKQGQHGGVALGQVHHVDIIPHAGAVGSGIVVAEDVDLLPLAHHGLGDVGHQVVGDAVGVLTDFAALVGAHGVEVPQQHRVEILVGVGAVR